MTASKRPPGTFSPRLNCNFLMTPRWLQCRVDISPTAKDVYSCLMMYDNIYGEVRPSISKVAKILGISDRQVSRCISELVDTKYVLREARFSDSGGDQLANRYFFRKEAMDREPEPIIEPDIEPDVEQTGDDSNVVGEGMTDVSCASDSNGVRIEVLNKTIQKLKTASKLGSVSLPPSQQKAFELKPPTPLCESPSPRARNRTEVPVPYSEADLGKLRLWLDGCTKADATFERIGKISRAHAIEVVRLIKGHPVDIAGKAIRAEFATGRFKTMRSWSMITSTDILGRVFRNEYVAPETAKPESAERRDFEIEAEYDGWQCLERQRIFESMPVDEKAKILAIAYQEAQQSFPKFRELTTEQRYQMAEAGALNALRSQVKTLEQYCRDRQDAA